MKMFPKMANKPYATTSPRTRKQAFWKLRTVNIRRYWIRIETLVTVSARLYIQAPDQNAFTTLEMCQWDASHMTMLVFEVALTLNNVKRSSLVSSEACFPRPFMTWPEVMTVRLMDKA